MHSPSDVCSSLPNELLDEKGLKGVGENVVSELLSMIALSFLHCMFCPAIQVVVVALGDGCRKERDGVHRSQLGRLSGTPLPRAMGTISTRGDMPILGN